MLATIPSEQAVRGRIVRVLWERDGRVIVAVEADGFDRLSVMGLLAGPRVGQLYDFTGRLVPDDRYGGHKLNLITYQTVQPSDRAGLILYLTQTAKWIGPAIARAVVDTFAEETLDILKSDPHRVAGAIKGITLDRAREISQTLLDNERNEATSIELAQLAGGVLSPSQINRIVKTWGARAARIIRNNPHRIEQIFGIGFDSAEKIHAHLQKPPHTRRRHAHVMLHAIRVLVGKHGHTVLRLGEVMAEASGSLAGVPLSIDALRLVCRSGHAVPVDDRIAPAAAHQAEQAIAGAVHDLRRTRKMGGNKDLYPAIHAGDLSDDQSAAVSIGQSEPVFVLCGAPGTGKTYTLARMVQALAATGCKGAFCAPTGKAAKQMSQSLRDVCGGVATTIHTLLQPEVVEETGEFRFARGPHNPLEADYVVVDEVSMLDVSLARSLLVSLSPGTRLILVGDHYQLPSVGPGAVLRDILDADVPHAELTTIKRNSGAIVLACHAIKDGRTPSPEIGGNWRHIPRGTPAEILESIRQLALDPPPCVEDVKRDLQTISPTNEAGPLSCAVLNDVLKGVLNPTTDGHPTRKFNVGDKVVRGKNAEVMGVALEDPQFDVEGFICCNEHVKDDDCGEDGDGLVATRIVNGDLGEVRAISKDWIWVTFQYPDRLVRLRPDVHELRLAYCMTCHKLQGSECRVAVIPLHGCMSRMSMLNREWIYTAFSRAKELLITVGDINVLRPVVGRTSARARHTLLADLLRQWSPTP